MTISRSGTTTEIVDLLSQTDIPSTLRTAIGGGPAAQHADNEIMLDFAGETSVVQTRFASTVLLVLRTSLGIDAEAAISGARTDPEEAKAFVAATGVDLLAVAVGSSTSLPS